MLDEYDFNKFIIESLSEKLKALEDGKQPFECDARELQACIILLKDAYSKKEYDDAKTIRKSIDDLIDQIRDKAELPYQKEMLRKESKKYSVLINVGRILSEPELNKILENSDEVLYNDRASEEDEIIGLREEDIIED